MKRIIGIGDIHGNYIELVRLMERINFDPKNDKLIFVGDYSDRGDDSKAVLEYLIKLRDKNPKKVILLLGNHEQMALDAINNGYGSNEWHHWIRNGGETTLKSFRRGLRRDEDDSAMNSFFNNFVPTLKLYHVEKNFVFVHAGIPPRTKIKDAKKEDILWLRDYDAYTRGKEDYLGQTLVIGHTPSKGVFVSDAIINVDTHCYRTNILSAYDVLNGVEYSSAPGF
jgi:serine/threonine protein phosphatase 1